MCMIYHISIHTIYVFLQILTKNMPLCTNMLKHSATGALSMKPQWPRSLLGDDQEEAEVVEDTSHLIKSSTMVLFFTIFFYMLTLGRIDGWNTRIYVVNIWDFAQLRNYFNWPVWTCLKKGCKNCFSFHFSLTERVREQFCEVLFFWGSQ